MLPVKGTAVREFDPAEVPVKIPGSDIEKIAGMLDVIYNRIVMEEGKAPNLVIHEFPLLRTIKTTLTADYHPDRWVVWFRPIENGILRIYPGDNVPDVGAVEIATGQTVTLAHKNEKIAFHNPVSNVDLQVFAVAIGGGSEFSITSV